MSVPTVQLITLRTRSPLYSLSRLLHAGRTDGIFPHTDSFFNISFLHSSSSSSFSAFLHSSSPNAVRRLYKGRFNCSPPSLHSSRSVQSSLDSIQRPSLV